MTVTPTTGIFHTGMIVDDIERVMNQMSEAFGFQWAEPLHFTRPAWTTKGKLSRESLVTYSIDGPHHVELVQSLDTTAWESAIGGPRIDHIGYWAEDLPAEIARLEALGYVLQLGGVGEGTGPAMFAYLYNPYGGLYVELIDSVQRPVLEDMLSHPRSAP